MPTEIFFIYLTSSPTKVLVNPVGWRQIDWEKKACPLHQCECNSRIGSNFPCLSFTWPFPCDLPQTPNDFVTTHDIKVLYMNVLLPKFWWLIPQIKILLRKGKCSIFPCLVFLNYHNFISTICCLFSVTYYNTCE